MSVFFQVFLMKTEIHVKKCKNITYSLPELSLSCQGFANKEIIEGELKLTGTKIALL